MEYFFEGFGFIQWQILIFLSMILSAWLLSFDYENDNISFLGWILIFWIFFTFNKTYGEVLFFQLINIFISFFVSCIILKFEGNWLIGFFIISIAIYSIGHYTYIHI